MIAMQIEQTKQSENRFINEILMKLLKTAFQYSTFFSIIENLKSVHSKCSNLKDASSITLDKTFTVLPNREAHYLTFFLVAKDLNLTTALTTNNPRIVKYIIQNYLEQTESFFQT